MEYKEFFQKLKSGDLPGALLLHGEEEYIKQSALKQLREAILPEGLEMMNEAVLDASASERAIVEACETLPFMAEKRLVLVRESPLLLPKGSDEGILTEYLPRLPATTQLVFLVRGNADGRRRLSQAIQKAGGMVAFQPLSDAEVLAFIRRECKARGGGAGKGAAEKLLELCGRDLNVLSGEIDKLCAYAPNRLLTPEDVEDVAIPSLESNVFRFVDSIADGDAKTALDMQARLLGDGESPVMMLSMMARAFRRLHHARAMTDAKVPAGQLNKALGVSGFIAGKVVRQAAQMPAGFLRAAAEACVDADYAIKSGKLREDAALEGLTLRLLSRAL